ncbi:hypothetical protein Adt_12349 [Abeliophyllum distichum]|uniref:Uncharacterized protein n=1 Tax=Abeliophyllum distichum TaxID=126358 RepID=A0ABD1UQG6_9LAMI
MFLGTQNVLLIISRSTSFITEGTSIAAHLSLMDVPSPVEPPSDGPPTGPPPLIGIVKKSFPVRASTPQSGFSFATDEKLLASCTLLCQSAVLRPRRYLPK